MSEGGETHSQVDAPENLKTRIGRKLVRVAMGGHQENGLDFKSVRVFGGHLKDIDEQIPEKGLPGAIKEHFQELGYRIEPQYQEERTRDILAQRPVLVVATHPSSLDSVRILGSLPESRSDVFFVATSPFQTLGEHFSEHVIPIYRSGDKYHATGKALLWRKYGIPQQERTFLEAAKLNVESLKTAAQKVNEGNLVVVFPDGPMEGKEWFDGVGELVKRLDNNDARIVFATTEKPGYKDYIRISSKVAGILNPTTSHVTYSAPHGLEEFGDANTNRQLITQNLRASYDSFTQLVV